MPDFAARHQYIPDVVVSRCVSWIQLGRLPQLTLSDPRATSATPRPHSAEADWGSETSDQYGERNGAGGGTHRKPVALLPLFRND
jgi:hypothetical protein